MVMQIFSQECVSGEAGELVFNQVIFFVAFNNTHISSLQLTKLLQLALSAEAGKMEALG